MYNLDPSPLDGTRPGDRDDNMRIPLRLASPQSLRRRLLPNRPNLRGARPPHFEAPQPQVPHGAPARPP
jgi:hypothetical protein